MKRTLHQESRHNQWTCICFGDALYPSFLSLLVLIFRRNPKAAYTTRAIRAFDALRVSSLASPAATCPQKNEDRLGGSICLQRL